jgi:hypothetical protein
MAGLDGARAGRVRHARASWLHRSRSYRSDAADADHRSTRRGGQSRCCRRHARRNTRDRFYFLARAALVKDERHLDLFDRVFAQTFKGLEAVSGEGEGAGAGAAGGMAAPPRREAPDRGGEGAGRVARRLGQADGDAEEAPRRAAGPASGRLEMDRHRRNLALRRLWLQPRGRAHRPA